MTVLVPLHRAWDRFWDRRLSDDERYSYAYLDWWEAEGQDAVLRLLADVWARPDEPSRRAAWYAADAIGEAGAFGGATEEDIAEFLADFAEDEGANTTADRDAAAARVVRSWLDEHELRHEAVPARP